ncbi:MAG TPA: DegT/DnrJ/EryC1/StrS family aminotransferase [Vicinamibacterales bacterium]|nr:DegT/DnrJ/EryC1/StrS family aminotransferase [Vicinamibacterales bacterium]
MNIPITKPVFGDEERVAVCAPLDSGWVVQGPYVAKFEQQFAAFTRAKHAIAASSCTTALHLAVVALGLKPGDEVIVPAFTWVATANVVEYERATPIFCDIDIATFNIDVTRIEALITPRTVGIIPVHMFGLSADMGPILDIARRHKLWVVEDAACGFNAWYHGQHAGTIGDAGCFSFHPRKSITTGEGGMVTTNRDDLDTLSRSLRDHGASRTDLQRHQSKGAFLLAAYDHVGYNYRMTDIQGAMGCAQMDRVPGIIAGRAARARAYDEALAEVPWLERPVVPPGYVHGYQAYVTLFRPETPSMKNLDALHERRNDVMASLEAKGIATRQGSHAPVLQGYFAKTYKLRPEQFPHACFAEKISLTLPLYPQMTEAEQAYVLSELKAAL